MVGVIIGAIAGAAVAFYSGMRVERKRQPKQLQHPSAPPPPPEPRLQLSGAGPSEKLRWGRGQGRFREGTYEGTAFVAELDEDGEVTAVRLGGWVPTNLLLAPRGGPKGLDFLQHLSGLVSKLPGHAYGNEAIAVALLQGSAEVLLEELAERHPVWIRAGQMVVLRGDRPLEDDWLEALLQDAVDALPRLKPLDDDELEERILEALGEYPREIYLTALASLLPSGRGRFKRFLEKLDAPSYGLLEELIPLFGRQAQDAIAEKAMGDSTWSEYPLRLALEFVHRKESQETLRALAENHHNPKIFLAAAEGLVRAVNERPQKIVDNEDRFAVVSDFVVGSGDGKVHVEVSESTRLRRDTRVRVRYSLKQPSGLYVEFLNEPEPSEVDWHLRESERLGSFRLPGGADLIYGDAPRALLWLQEGGPREAVAAAATAGFTLVIDSEEIRLSRSLAYEEEEQLEQIIDQAKELAGRVALQLPFACDDPAAALRQAMEGDFDLAQDAWLVLRTDHPGEVRETLTWMLGHPDLELRLRFALLPGVEGLETLAELVRVPDLAVDLRLKAVDRLLRRLRLEDFLPQLQAAMKAGPDTLRNELIPLAIRLDPRGVTAGALVEHLEAFDISDCTRLIEGLVEVAGHSAERSAASLLESDRVEVLRSTCPWLEDHGTPAHIGALAGLSDHEDTALKKAARAALKSIHKRFDLSSGGLSLAVDLGSDGALAFPESPEGTLSVAE